MRRLLFGIVVSALVATGAAAQSDWEFQGWAERGEIRMRAPGAPGWPERTAPARLPGNPEVLQVQAGEWVLVNLPGLGQRQVHINDVRIRRGGCVIAPGPDMRSAGSQGLGPGATPRPCR